MRIDVRAWNNAISPLAEAIIKKYHLTSVDSGARKILRIQQGQSIISAFNEQTLYVNVFAVFTAFNRLWFGKLPRKSIARN